jgi:hypothetical protein
MFVMTKVQPKELFEQPFGPTSNKNQHNQLLIRNLITLEVILRFSKNRHKTIRINKCMKVHFNDNKTPKPLPNIPMERSN